MVFLESLMLQTQNKKRGKSLNGEKKKKASKQSYKQNLQINKIANDLKRDKIVDKRTILSVIDADAERGFIPPKDL